MRKQDTAKMRERMEKEMEWFRRLTRFNRRGRPWLKELRQAMGLPAAEVATRARCSRSMLYRVEQGETQGTETIDVLMQVAAAMDCEVVYAIVPKEGRTLEKTAEWLKANPWWRTERQKARKKEKIEKKREDMQKWHDRRMWEDAADKVAARARARVLKKAKEYGYSVETAEAAMGSAAAPEPREPAQPRTMEEMQTKAMNALEALSDVMKSRNRQQRA